MPTVVASRPHIIPIDELAPATTGDAKPAAHRIADLIFLPLPPVSCGHASARPGHRISFSIAGTVGNQRVRTFESNPAHALRVAMCTSPSDATTHACITIKADRHTRILTQHRFTSSAVSHLQPLASKTGVVAAAAAAVIDAERRWPYTRHISSAPLALVVFWSAIQLIQWSSTPGSSAVMAALACPITFVASQTCLPSSAADWPSATPVAHPGSRQQLTAQEAGRRGGDSGPATTRKRPL
eukprot:COSAG01_NODE_3879_length_5595_cov_34.137918_4_plen_241_part_00